MQGMVNFAERRLGEEGHVQRTDGIERLGRLFHDFYLRLKGPSRLDAKYLFDPLESMQH